MFLRNYFTPYQNNVTSMVVRHLLVPKLTWPPRPYMVKTFQIFFSKAKKALNLYVGSAAKVVNLILTGSVAYTEIFDIAGI